MDNETSKLVQVARLYYEEELNQSEIAKKLGVSRPLVSNMLSKAKQLGIVEIKIKEPFGNNILLLNQLKNIYNIQGGYVIPSTNSEYITEKSIISQSATFLKTLLPEVDVLGLGWGYTIGQLIDEVGKTPSDSLYEGKVVPLIGTASFPNKGYHPSELVREFAENTGLSPHFFFAPAFPISAQEKALYTNTDNYKQIEGLWHQLDTAVLSINGFPSVPDHATAVRFGDKLQKAQAVGKLLSYFFNKEGVFIESDEDFAIQLPKSAFGAIKRVIAICPDEVSPKAVLGALKTGLITHIILTEEKAKAVIALRT